MNNIEEFEKKIEDCGVEDMNHKILPILRAYKKAILKDVDELPSYNYYTEVIDLDDVKQLLNIPRGKSLSSELLPESEAVKTAEQETDLPVTATSRKENCEETVNISGEGASTPEGRLNPSHDSNSEGLELEEFEDFNDIRVWIKRCEGKHKQQIAYSSYHNALTQVCFDCKKVRTSLDCEPSEDSK